MNLPTGKTRVFGLVGHPVRQSLSPSMHNTLFHRMGVDAVYVAFDVEPSQAERVADTIRVLSLGGVNLTVPFKERILPFLDEIEPSAAAAGAVNVVVNRDGRLWGYNTDGEGYLRALTEELGADVRGEHLGILGAGGTGRAVAAAAAAAGAAEVVLYNRTIERAVRAVEVFRSRFSDTHFVAQVLEPSQFGHHTRIVNCTAPAAASIINSLPLRNIPAGSIWTDANYYMADPPRLVACAQAGIRIQRGIGMLMHQGALAFTLFTGLPVGIAQVRGVLNIGGW